MQTLQITARQKLILNEMGIKNWQRSPAKPPNIPQEHQLPANTKPAQIQTQTKPQPIKEELAQTQPAQKTTITQLTQAKDQEGQDWLIAAEITSPENQEHQKAQNELLKAIIKAAGLEEIQTVTLEKALQHTPAKILILGKKAAEEILTSQAAEEKAHQLAKQTLGKLRANVHKAQINKKSTQITITYSLDFLLSSPKEKTKTWADICLAKSNKI